MVVDYYWHFFTIFGTFLHGQQGTFYDVHYTDLNPSTGTEI